jgi:hypothetical protein
MSAEKDSSRRLRGKNGKGAEALPVSSMAEWVMDGGFRVSV